MASSSKCAVTSASRCSGARRSGSALRHNDADAASEAGAAPLGEFSARFLRRVGAGSGDLADSSGDDVLLPVTHLRTERNAQFEFRILRNLGVVEAGAIAFDVVVAIADPERLYGTHLARRHRNVAVAV